MLTHSPYTALPRPIPWRALPPTISPTYPIPLLDPYKDYKQKFQKYTITLSARTVVARLKKAATRTATEYGSFPDTGLQGTSENEINEFQYRTLIIATGLFDSVNKEDRETSRETIFFGVLGNEGNRWRVRGWVQPFSKEVEREVEEVKRDGLLGLSQVVNKGRGHEEYGDGYVGEHEWIWQCVRDWDFEMRRWEENFL